MKSMLVFCAAVLTILAGAVLAFGDVARPKESPSPNVRGKSAFHTSLAVVPEAGAWEARLQISPESLRQLRAALDNVPADSSMAQSITNSSTRTIMAGLFMFLALSFAGVWLARSGHTPNHKAAAAVVIAAALVGATAMITRGNAGPPPGWSWRNLQQNFNGGNETRGSVNVEIMPEGSGIKLIVPLYKQNPSVDRRVPGE